MAPLHLLEARERQRADARRVLDEALLLDDLDRRERRAAGDGVFLVRVVAERPLLRHVEIRPREHGRDRQDAAAERLAHHEDVGTTPSCSQANMRPVLPSPVGISSKINSAP